MARRRFQKPDPFIDGNWWWIRARTDILEEGTLKRKQCRIKLGPKSMNKREAMKIASETLRPVNQGLELVGPATAFQEYVKLTYEKLELPLLAANTQKAYKSHLDAYVLPEFGELSLREITPLRLQQCFSGLSQSGTGPSTVLKIKEALSSVMASAKKYDLVPNNPMEGISIPKSKVLNRRKRKPTLTVEELDLLLTGIVEP